MQNTNNTAVLKWIATLTLIVASYINSAKIADDINLGPWLLVAGGVLWLVQSIRWRELSLSVTNGAMVLAGGTPLVLDLFK